MNATPTHHDPGGAGAWFGSQVGCTLWMVPAAAVGFAKSPAAGAIILALLAAANGAGALLWRRVTSGRLGLAAGMQRLVFVAGVAAGGTLIAADTFGCLDALWSVGSPLRSPPPRWVSYALLLLFPALMVLLHVAARRRQPIGAASLDEAATPSPSPPPR
jgi:hypothetical protein